LIDALVKNMTVIRFGIRSMEPMIVELDPGEQGSNDYTNQWGSDSESEWQDVPTGEVPTVRTANSKPRASPSILHCVAPHHSAHDAIEQAQIKVSLANAEKKVQAAEREAAAELTRQRDAVAAAERAAAAAAAAVGRRILAEGAAVAALAAAAAAERAAEAAAPAAGSQGQQQDETTAPQPAALQPAPQPAAPHLAAQQAGYAASSSTDQQQTDATVAKYVRSFGNRTNRSALLAAARLASNKQASIKQTSRACQGRTLHPGHYQSGQSDN
jgi:hypothetical protein